MSDVESGANAEVTRLTAALRESEERFRTLVDHSTDAFFVIGRPTTIRDVNRRACESLGYTREELIGMSVKSIDVGLSPDAWQALAERLVRGEAVSIESVHRRKDGSTFPVEIRIGPFQVSGELRSVCLAHNITERKRVESALRESEAQHRAVIADQTEFIVRWRPDGTRTFVNDAYARYFGQPSQTLIGTSFLPLIESDAERAALERQMSCVTPANPIMAVTHRARRADGADRWQEWIDRAVFDEAGRLVEWQSVGRDVHERVVAEEALRENRMLLQTFVEHTPAAVAMFDTEMRYLAWSRRWLSDYRLTMSDLGGLSHYEVFPEIGDDWKAIHRRCMSGATERCEEDSFTRADGTLDYVRWVVQPWYRASEQIGGLVMFTEVITERIKAQQALRESEDERRRLEEQIRQAQKMEAIGRLAAGVAHDFNNLLIVINGYSEELITDHGLDPSAKRLLEEINAAGVRAGRLTAQLLAFGRKQVLRLSMVDLGNLVADLGRMLGRVLGEDVALSTSTAPGGWPIQIDIGQIEQVIVNLAVNARDAMPKGGQLTIETRNVDVRERGHADAPDLQPGRWVQLSVSDTGVGMDQATLERVFEPFFTTKATGLGTGLGLATVYGIVKQSGGHIHVTSRPGDGTRFSLFFPALESGTGVSASNAHETPAPRGTETILIVEDEHPVRRMCVIALRRFGYTVHEARSGDEALELLATAGPIDLIVTDVVMPGMSGGELADHVRRQRPGTPILFVSGYTDDDVIRRGVMHGEQDFLQKPFTPKELARTIRAVLDRAP